MNAIRELYKNSGLIDKDGYIKFGELWVKVSRRPIQYRSVDIEALIDRDEFDYISERIKEFKTLLNSIGHEFDNSNLYFDSHARAWVDYINPSSYCYFNSGGSFHNTSKVSAWAIYARRWNL